MVLVADSSLQLSRERIKELGIIVASYPIFVNGEQYSASMTMDKGEKEKLRGIIKAKDNKVTTAGLEETELKDIFTKYKSDKIVTITQSFNSSRATVATLNKVKDELKDINISVFDSHHLATAYSVQVLEAAKAVKKGMGHDDLLKMLETNRENTKHVGVLYDLFFLKRTGRLGLIKAVLGSAMKIMPILSSTGESGVLKSIGKVKTHIQANQRFLKIIEEDIGRRKTKKITGVIAYCGEHEKEAQHLKDLIESQGWDASMEIHYSNYTCMPHQGPDFYDLGYITYDS
jgi:DegV family protein with EDD domain